MNKKIVIAIAIITIVAMAAPAVMGEVSYSANVLAGSNVVVTLNNGNFGDVIAGSTDNTIIRSLTIGK